MAEVYDWRNDIDKDGEFTPIEEPKDTEAQEIPPVVHTGKSGNFITRHPTITGILAGAVIHWCGLFGQSKDGVLYYPVKPTKGSIFLGNTKNGAEFLTPIRNSKNFYCGKALIPLQNDKDFKKSLDVLPNDNYTHVTCEGVDAETPIDWPEEAQETPLPNQTEPLYPDELPYSEDFPNTPTPQYLDSLPQDPA